MAAGLGTRMRSATPKHLHPLLGRRMVDWVLAAVRPLSPEPLVVVASPETADAFGDIGPSSPCRRQPRGTGDAVASALGSLGAVDGTSSCSPGTRRSSPRSSCRGSSTDIEPPTPT